MPLNYRLITSQESEEGLSARLGQLNVNDKTLQTPAFMPVGTLGTVKGLSLEDLETIGVECMLGNTYHLHLRPGEDLIARLGGLHTFVGGWKGLILTDSGGYQVFSLAHLRTIDETGVTFQAHTDGATHVFTPESVVAIQERLGSDIMMTLDECPPSNLPWEEAKNAANRTARWAVRAQQAYGGGPGVLFAVTQGGMHEGLRATSASDLASLDFPGYGIGGLGIGESKETSKRMLAASIRHLPADKPRYLMGIGAPEDLVRGVAAGVDMFDCVLQTREARNGGLLTRTGRLNINNARFAEDLGSIEDNCDCYTCARYSRSYLHHLFRTRELLGYRLATIHNVRWTLNLMEAIRANIRQKTFDEFARAFLAIYRPAERRPAREHTPRLQKRQGDSDPRTRNANEPG